VYGSNVEPSTTAPAGLIPYCNISQAQLSYHGLKDAVKFFVAVPGQLVCIRVCVRACGDFSHKRDSVDDVAS